MRLPSIRAPEIKVQIFAFRCVHHTRSLFVLVVYLPRRFGKVPFMAKKRQT